MQGWCTWGDAGAPAGLQVDCKASWASSDSRPAMPVTVATRTTETGGHLQAVCAVGTVQVLHACPAGCVEPQLHCRPSLLTRWQRSLASTRCTAHLLQQVMHIPACANPHRHSVRVLGPDAGALHHAPLCAGGVHKGGQQVSAALIACMERARVAQGTAQIAGQVRGGWPLPARRLLLAVPGFTGHCARTKGRLLLEGTVRGRHRGRWGRPAELASSQERAEVHKR